MGNYEVHETLLDKDLKTLKDDLIRMAMLAEKMIDQTIKELVTRDENEIKDVQPEENELNKLQIGIDEKVLTLLATKQPVAADLRLILVATRINSELERIGDLAINITQNAKTLIKEPPIKKLVDIPRMADLARQMVRNGVEAFIGGDVELARKVITSDDEVDALKSQVFRELLTYMMADPKTIERALSLILISRHLERIGDHATNIAEDVIYMVQGRDIRHHNTDQ